jgi:hypothetical protein
MAGVGRLPDLPEGPREADRERLTERNPDPDPLVEPDSLTATELDAADPGLMDTDSIGQSRLGEPTTFSTGPHALTESIEMESARRAASRSVSVDRRRVDISWVMPRSLTSGPSLGPTSLTALRLLAFAHSARQRAGGSTAMRLEWSTNETPGHISTPMARAAS